MGFSEGNDKQSTLDSCLRTYEVRKKVPFREIYHNRKKKKTF